MAVEEVFGGQVIWQSEIDKAASKVLAYRFPCAPNLGDITAVDWSTVETPDILCGGFPCQDVSAAGKRAGIKDGTRSGLWSVFADIIDILRPPIVIIENVRGPLSAKAHRNLESDRATMGDGTDGPVLRAAGAVLGDLADLGYDAAWTTLAAGDVGAPHRRERVFIIAWDSTGSTGWSDRSTQAQRGVKRELSGTASDAVTQSGGTPVGFNTGGASSAQAGAHSSDRSGDHRGERADVDRIGYIGHRDRYGVPYASNAELLPTPAAGNFNDGEDAQQWLARQAAVKERLNNGNGMGMPLAIAVQLLPTPNAGLGEHRRDNGQDPDKRRAQGRQVSLADAVCYLPGQQPEVADLLPTPNASDGTGGGQHPDKREGHSRQLIDTVLALPLLQTPQARDAKGLPGQGFNEGNLLSQVIEVTPSEDDGWCEQCFVDYESATYVCDEYGYPSSQWGKYEPAIRRWESLTRPAPAPTERNKNGNPRLSAAFSEWLMGWPAGWVTDPDIGISRNDQLRIVGNGVCPQQAAAALRYLMAVAS
jgi:DNA (cytosine-5)-methyltransferase 1